MHAVKSFLFAVLAASSLAIAGNTGTVRDHDHGAYFAPALRFDAGSGSVEVTFGIEEAARISLRAFDTRGKVLAVLLDGRREAGFHHLSFFSNRLQGYRGRVVFQLRAGNAVLAEIRPGSR